MIFLVLVVGSESSVVIECNFDDHVVAIYAYRCFVKSYDLPITSKDNREVTEIRGQHLEGKSNDDVATIDSSRLKVKFFPRGLTKFFKNLQTLYITIAELQEITKDDLKEFGGNLKNLWIYKNEIRVIEADLFEFNPNLEDINLANNKITYIAPGAFGGLEKLHTLELDANPCTKGDTYEKDDRSKVLELIRVAENSCKN